MPQKNEVSLAFELVLEELENVIDELNREAEKTLKTRDYGKVKSLIDDATKITDFRERVKNLQKEWQNLFASKAKRVKIIKREETKKLRKGLRTPEEAYKIPILESLKNLEERAR